MFARHGMASAGTLRHRADVVPSRWFLLVFGVIMLFHFRLKRHRVPVVTGFRGTKISLQKWVSLRVYLCRCSRIESYMLHKEQTNSFFNAWRAGFEKRASGASHRLSRRWNAGDPTIWKLVRRKCFPRFWNIGPENRLLLFQAPGDSQLRDSVAWMRICRWFNRVFFFAIAILYIFQFNHLSSFSHSKFSETFAIISFTEMCINFLIFVKETEITLKSSSIFWFSMIKLMCKWNTNINIINESPISCLYKVIYDLAYFLMTFLVFL